jgi:hypothetical protein
MTIAPNAEGGVGASKNGKNGAKTCQAFILFFSGTLSVNRNRSQPLSGS